VGARSRRDDLRPRPNVWPAARTWSSTPDPSGIPYYDVALFTEVLRTGHAKARRINQIMPWHAFGGMTDDDIAAIFANLATLKPMVHRVTNDESEPPAFCRLCRQRHGYGNRN
jgi:hypothetical protein